MCEVCKRPIQVMVFRGGPVCSEDCRKALEAATPKPKARRPRKVAS